MMQFGLCSVSFRALTPEQIITLAQQNRLDCIEWGGDIHVPPNDLENARHIASLTRKAGLQIHSYGSYYRCTPNEDFEPIAQTAHALGASVIRIWAGTKNAEEQTPKETAALVKTVQAASEIAAHYGQTLAFEHHHGTSCNTAENTLHLLRAVKKPNVKAYWQPAYWQAENSYDIDLCSIRLLKEEIVGVHVYHWQSTIRLPLEQGADAWCAYLSELGENRYYLEFFREDSITQFAADCSTLQTIRK